MSFYVQLPSNTENISGKNTTTEYTTFFNKKLPLNSYLKYEVGLVEAIYSQSWAIKCGAIVFRYRNELKNSFKLIQITFHDGDSLEQFLERINKKIQSTALEILYNERYEKGQNNTKSDENLKLYPKRFFDTIHDDKNDAIVLDELKKSSFYINVPQIVCRDNSIYIQFSTMYQSIQFTGQINSVLKMKYNKISNVSEAYYSVHNDIHYIKISSNERFNLKSPIFLLGTFYVYCDIIENQIVGNSEAPLLKTIVINYNLSQNLSWTHFDNPQYLDINKTEINSIYIFVRDEFGEKIIFEDGSFTVKLHFRVKND